MRRTAEGIILDLAKGLCPDEGYYYGHQSCEGCPLFDPKDGRPTRESDVNPGKLVTTKEDGGYLFCAARWVAFERETPPEGGE